jgi:hypothetical protein
VLRRLGATATAILAVAGAGYGIAAAATADTTGTNVACATATANPPDHTVGVDGQDVTTITGTPTTATDCETQTYTIPAASTETATTTATDTATETVTQTITETPTTPTSSSSSSSSTTTSSTTTPTTSTTPTTPTTSTSSTTTSSTSTAPTPQQVAAAPTGPAAPAGGWKTILADGFNNAYPLSPLWGPNGNDNNATGATRSEAPGNTNEVADFNASQVSLDSDGLRLTARYFPNTADNGKSYPYQSGVVISQQYVAGEPGQQGWRGITGFRWLPTPGVTTVFEANMAAPDTSNPGEDPGFWLSTSAWVDEIDIPEMWNYGTKPYGLGVTWIYNTSAGSMNQATSYGLSAQTDQQFHRWTIDFDGNAKRVLVWIDGVEQHQLEINWPASFSSTPMYLVLSHGIRNVYGTPPTWTTGTKVFRFRSVAVYQDAAHVGAGVTGGGVAPGTLVK